MGERREGIEKRPHPGLRDRKVLLYLFDHQGALCHTSSYTESVPRPRTEFHPGGHFPFQTSIPTDISPASQIQFARLAASVENHTQQLVYFGATSLRIASHFFPRAASRLILDFSHTAEVSTHLDKLVTELLELSKLPHLALGFPTAARLGRASEMVLPSALLVSRTLGPSTYARGEIIFPLHGPTAVGMDRQRNS
jgi:hypothetical protein